MASSAASTLEARSKLRYSLERDDALPQGESPGIAVRASSSGRLAVVAAIALGACAVEAGLLNAPLGTAFGNETARGAADRALAPPFPKQNWLVLPRIRLADLRRDRDGSGTPVIINFWSPSCVRCRNEAAVLRRFNSADAKLVGVAVGNARINILRAWALKYRGTFPNVHDPKADSRYGVTTKDLPTTFVVNRGGEIAEGATIKGPVTSVAKLTQAVERAESDYDE
jgi:thiol-disulfide isomerase/thioredoxin